MFNEQELRVIGKGLENLNTAEGTTLQDSSFLIALFNKVIAEIQKIEQEKPNTGMKEAEAETAKAKK